MEQGRRLARVRRRILFGPEAGLRANRHLRTAPGDFPERLASGGSARRITRHAWCPKDCPASGASRAGGTQPRAFVSRRVPSAVPAPRASVTPRPELLDQRRDGPKYCLRLPRVYRWWLERSIRLDRGRSTFCGRALSPNPAWGRLRIVLRASKRTTWRLCGEGCRYLGWRLRPFSMQNLAVDRGSRGCPLQPS